MELPIYQVDAFTSEIFKGNPAAVIPLDFWLSDEILQKIAIENNLSETAFFITDGDVFFLRWFTPTYEIDLCGHATLATAYVILNEIHLEKKSVTFNTNVAGQLIVEKTDDGLKMDFPARPGKKIDEMPDVVLSALGGVAPNEAYKVRDLMLVYDDEDFVRNVKPNFHTLLSYPAAVCITSETKAPDIDFISRFFCAYDISVPEDPVTGSAHCMLAPYWAKKLGKTELKARQVSERGGNLHLNLKKDRLEITGRAVLYMRGVIYV